MATFIWSLRWTLFLYLALVSPLVTGQIQVLFQSYPSTVVIGTIYPVTWGTNGLDGSNADTTVRINLMKGQLDSLSKVNQLYQFTTVGGLETFMWNVSSTLTPANDYALEIVFTDGTSPNFSNQISILAAGSTVTAAATVTSVMNHPSSSTTAAPVASSSASSSPKPSSGGNGGLSGGAIAGIVIGVIGGIVLILLAVFLFLRQKRKARRVAPEPPLKEKHFLDADAGMQATRLELGGREVTVEGRHEKDGYEVRD